MSRIHPQLHCPECGEKKGPAVHGLKACLLCDHLMDSESEMGKVNDLGRHSVQVLERLVLIDMPKVHIKL